MQIYQAFLVGLLPIAAAVTSAQAESLPADAKPMPASDIRSIYEGKTANWKSVRVYFAPDGTAKLVRKDKKAYGEGRWSVSENEMCLTINPIDVAKGQRKAAKDCYIWHEAGGKSYMRWSGDSDKTDAYRDDEPSRLSSGDKVTKDFEMLKK